MSGKASSVTAPSAASQTGRTKAGREPNGSLAASPTKRASRTVATSISRSASSSRSRRASTSLRPAYTSAWAPRPLRYCASAACTCWPACAICPNNCSRIDSVKERSSQASAASRCTAATACRRSASASATSRSARALRAERFSARVNSCIRPTERIVMKSRVTLKRSGPSIGRLFRPSLRTGSGRCPAATVRSRAARTWAVIAST
mmetsp:Transcript_5424/g.20634  ORF Transcript_5424/g.20634 Transcript_5424/m.20634 type:complete len:206 (-) Transcript_5424:400-1017(-)